MANLMDLVRELKGLNARKKAGETLSPADEARRKELKSFLRTTLEAQGGGSVEDSAVKEAPQRAVGGSAPKDVPRPMGSAPKQAPAPTPQQAARSGAEPTAASRA